MSLSLKKISLAILLVATLFTISSCSTTWGGRKYEKRPGQSQKTTKSKGTIVRQEGSAPKEIMRPENTQLAAINTPARNSSMGMIGKGKKLYDSEKYEKALGVFQEAIIIDSTNGMAYYYMAKTRYALSQYEEALGILDKADSLLGSMDEWKEAISLLRSQIETAYLSREE